MPSWACRIGLLLYALTLSALVAWAALMAREIRAVEAQCLRGPGGFEVACPRCGHVGTAVAPRRRGDRGTLESHAVYTVAE
jgi:hypothetical protein